jgi:oxygen-independent coproporphyrinogen-3 oxidase
MSPTVELLRKYNVAGPRYTSYPTVPYWSDSPTSEQWIQHLDRELARAKTQGTGAAIYVHIPFCQSLCTYCGCNTRITRNKNVGSPYVQTLLKEWGLYRSQLNEFGSAKLPLSELHLGGGTPTYLSSDELKTLVLGLMEHCERTPDSEFSVEADPRVTTREQLKVLAELGFTRLSLGIQDFDPKVQETVNRVQTEEQVRRVTEEAREFGFTSINYDLIYGLPFQTIESVRETIEAVKRLRPDRIAFYAYAHVPWIKPGQRRFTEADLPAGDAKRALYELGRELLEGVGFREVGMDHFALETDSLWTSTQSRSLHRNFMGYTSRHVSPLFALGVSAIGDSWSAFAQNEKLLETYVQRVEKGEIPIHRGHILSDEDLVLRKLILDLMTGLRAEVSLEDRAKVEVLSTAPERLKELVADGLLTVRSERIDTQGYSVEVHEEARAFLRNICMAFDARLIRQAPATQLFSKTI